MGYIKLYGAHRGGEIMSTMPGAADAGLDPTLAAALNQELTRHQRILHVLKAGMATFVPEGLDAAAFGLTATPVSISSCSTTSGIAREISTMIGV